MQGDRLVWPLQFARRDTCTVSATPEVDDAIRHGAAVAVGVSSGKDSAAVAFAVNAYLDATEHRGPRVLIHADLGRVEWKQSLGVCEQLAHRLGMELIVVHRAAGDLLARWQQRWASNVRRYAELECVKLILPWSTASMRFCTSELKTTVISRELVRRFPGRTILSATGIRHEESPRRAKVTTAARRPLLSSARQKCDGWDWRPILDWTRSDVFAYLARQDFELHEAYRVYGSSRVSCAFCILASRQDLRAASRCVDNQDVYRLLADLEIESAFPFQERQWLCDVAPELLDEDTRRRAMKAKERAASRESAERQIPKHLLYENGWPTSIPTMEEAALLADVRTRVAAAGGFPIRYQSAESVLSRYLELMQQKK